MALPRVSGPLSPGAQIWLSSAAGGASSVRRAGRVVHGTLAYLLVSLPLPLGTTPALSPGGTVQVDVEDGSTLPAVVLRVHAAGTDDLRVLLRFAEPLMRADERRRQQRVQATDLDVLAVSLVEGRMRCIRAQVLDLSRSGAQLRVRLPLHRGDPLYLRIRATATSVLHLKSEVMWVREDDDGWRIGTRFAEVENASQQVLERLVFTARWRRAA